MQDPHVIEREILADYPDAELDLLPMHHVVPRLSDTPGSIRAAAPALGEHNAELLAELGLDEAQVAGLIAEGVVAGAGVARAEDAA